MDGSGHQKQRLSWRWDVGSQEMGAAALDKLAPPELS